MKYKKRRKRLFSVLTFIVSFVIIMTSLTACRQDKDRKFESLSDLNEGGVTLGVQTGTTFDALMQSAFPNAKINYYNTISDLIQALTEDKIDSFAADYPIALALTLENPAISIMSEPIENIEYAFAFPKTEKGKMQSEQMSEFIKKHQSDGTLQQMIDDWTFKKDEMAVDFSKMTGENGVITLATESGYLPFCFIKDNELTGLDIDLLVRFCEEYGYKLNVMDMSFDAVIPSLGTRSDIAGSGISVTEERKQQVYFSESYYHGGTYMVTKSNESAKNLTIEGLADKKIGILTGSVHENATLKMFPDAQISYYNSKNDMIAAVSAGLIDGFLLAETVARDICEENPSVTYIETQIDPIPSAVAFAKTEEGERLKNEMNLFLSEEKRNGGLDEVYKIWCGNDEDAKVVDLSDLKAENGTLKLAATDSSMPFSYIKNGKNAGLDIEIVHHFCKRFGYGLEILTMDFSSIIPALTSGTCNIAASDITVTAERAQSVFFSDSIHDDNEVIMIKNQSAVSEMSFAESLIESFNKTFIREDRWKMVLSGIGITILITLLSAIFGTILGFAICMLRLGKNPIVNAITSVYIRILQGTPIVVLLMILFYIVFSKTGLDGIWVAIIGFTLNFAAYAAEIFRTGIEAVDKGQKEAALALGYTKSQTFLKIILPQAASHFLPVYTGEIISLVKSTSIVGYIAIQDLTKVSDIIRSRTYEAFFPLISTAVIYFLVAWLMSLVLKLIQKKIEPNRKSRKVKGAF